MMVVGIAIGHTKSPEDEMDDEEENKRDHRLTFEVVKMVFLSAIGGFLFGYDTGIVSGAMVFIRDDFELDDLWQEVIISITILGAWIFSILSGSLSDYIGRKKVVILSSVIFTIGSFLMGIAPEKYTLLVGRLVVGAGIGLSSMVIPLYIAELAPSRIRGSLVTSNNLFITGGQFISAVVAVGFSYLPENLGWRFMLGIACIPSIIQFLGFLTMPESPRWLIRNDREEDAYKVLQKLRGPTANIDKEFQRIREVIGKARSRRPSMGATSEAKQDDEGTSNNNNNNDNNNSPDNGKFKVTPSTSTAIVAIPSTSKDTDEASGFWTVLADVLKDKYLRRALAVGCLLQATQQLTGINTVMYYSATIIQMSGVGDKTQAVWMASVTALVNFLTTFFGVYVVDKIGRRQLTLGSLAGVILSLMLLAIGFKIEATYSPHIGFVSRNPLDADCSALLTCNACTESAVCGFCYPLGDLNNGSCIASHSDTPYDSSMTGFCSPSFMSNLTISSLATISPPQSSYIWSNDVCPANYSFIILAGLCLYLLTFGPGMGPMPWTINSEIYPLWARTTCISITTSMSWFFNMLISLTFLTLVRIITKEGAFSLYALFGVIGFILLLFFLPETKGKNLEETYSMFRSSNRPMRRRGKKIMKEKFKSSPNPKTLKDEGSSNVISRINIKSDQQDEKKVRKSTEGYDNLTFDSNE